MAFKDIDEVLYDGKVKLCYRDGNHTYFAYPRINWDLPVEDKKAWGKRFFPKGTTTLIGDTLEKKGLMTWAMGMALKELFGFYHFEDENGELRSGLWGKQLGTLLDENGEPVKLSKDKLLEAVVSSSKKWRRDQKKGADIGTVVHDAIERFVKANPNVELEVIDAKTKKPTGKMVLPAIQKTSFDIGEQYMWNIKDAEYDTDKDRDRALEEFPKDVSMANAAFDCFVEWWSTTRPVLYGAEEILLSLEQEVCGTYDGELGISREHHPVFSLPTEKVSVAFAEIYEKVKTAGSVRVTADWKTSKASKSVDACMPEGIGYSYFIQNAIYEMMRREMGMEPADDLLVVSCRKDGGFTLLYASELGMTVQECIDWALSVITCYRMAAKAKKGIVAHAEASLQNNVSSEEEF